MMHQQYLKQPKAAFKEVDFTEDIYSNFMMCKYNMVELIVYVLLSVQVFLVKHMNSW